MLPGLGRVAVRGVVEFCRRLAASRRETPLRRPAAGVVVPILLLVLGFRCPTHSRRRRSVRASAGGPAEIGAPLRLTGGEGGSRGGVRGRDGSVANGAPCAKVEVGLVVLHRIGGVVWREREGKNREMGKEEVS